MLPGRLRALEQMLLFDETQARVDLLGDVADDQARLEHIAERIDDRRAGHRHDHLAAVAHRARDLERLDALTREYTRRQTRLGTTRVLLGDQHWRRLAQDLTRPSSRRAAPRRR